MLFLSMPGSLMETYRLSNEAVETCRNSIDFCGLDDAIEIMQLKMEDCDPMLLKMLRVVEEEYIQKQERINQANTLMFRAGALVSYLAASAEPSKRSPDLVSGDGVNIVTARITHGRVSMREQAASALRANQRLIGVLDDALCLPPQETPESASLYFGAGFVLNAIDCQRMADIVRSN